MEIIITYPQRMMQIILDSYEHMKDEILLKAGGNARVGFTRAGLDESS